MERHRIRPLEIVDLTGNDDDEYASFGRFYTGTIAASATITAIASAGAAVPGGTGDVHGLPAESGRGRKGAWRFSVWAPRRSKASTVAASATPIDPCHPLADLTTLVPGGSGSFTGFSGLAAADDLAGSAPVPVSSSVHRQRRRSAGRLRCLGARPIVSCVYIADLTTCIPGGVGTFTGFSSLAVAQGALAFIGSGVGQQGVYNCDIAIPVEPCRRIADRTTVIPSGAGTFDAFSALAVTAEVPGPTPPPVPRSVHRGRRCPAGRLQLQHCSSRRAVQSHCGI